MAFMTLALTQIFHLGNARSGGPVVKVERALSNPYALLGVGISIVLQATTAWVPPLAALLHVSELPADRWIAVIALSSVPAVAGQLWKVVRQARRGV